jgi:ribosomal protein S18 acetylase RimI-like enzyme
LFITSSKGKQTRKPSSRLMQIRLIEISDYENLVTFWQTMPGMRLVDADSRPDIDRYLNRNPGMCFLAEDNGLIVGTVLAGHDGRRGYLFHFAVAESHRGRTLAKDLLEKAFAALKAEGISRCYGFILSGNERAHKLAELTGWEKVDDFDVYSQWLIGENSK